MRGVGTWTLLTCLLTGALAGCLGDETQVAPVVEEPEPVPVDIAPINRTVHRADCLLYSQGYPAPANPLRAYVPDGFQLVESSRVPGTSNVAVYITVCGAVDEEVRPDNTSALGNATIEVIAAIPVMPPEEHRDENVTRDYVPLTITVQGQALHQRYLDWGFARAEVTNVTHSNSNNGVTFQSRVAWTDGTGAYTIDAAGQATSTVTAKTYYRLWTVADRVATGSLLVENAQGQHIGTGASVFTYDGDGAAPPVATGTTSDGAGIESYLRHVPLGAPVPDLILPSGD